MAGGFLGETGPQLHLCDACAGRNRCGHDSGGLADVMQSAPSTNWAKMDKGETGLLLHFALINRRDGLSRTGQGAAGSFSWKDLEGRKLIADHGSQPLAMLLACSPLQRRRLEKDRCHQCRYAGADDRGFSNRGGRFHSPSGPGSAAPRTGWCGWIAVSVGESMPPNAFSSVCASREFIGSAEYRAFVAAFAEAKARVCASTADEIAATQSSFFPGVDERVLASACHCALSAHGEL